MRVPKTAGEQRQTPATVIAAVEEPLDDHLSGESGEILNQRSIVSGTGEPVPPQRHWPGMRPQHRVPATVPQLKLRGQARGDHWVMPWCGGSPGRVPHRRTDYSRSHLGDPPRLTGTAESGLCKGTPCFWLAPRLMS